MEDHRSVHERSEALNRHIVNAVNLVQEDPLGFFTTVISQPDRASATAELKRQFGFDDIQCVAVLDLQVWRFVPRR